MTSVLSSFFSRDARTSFPFDLPAENFCVFNGVSLGHSFKKAEPAEKATCFWLNSHDSSLKVQTQKLKTIRHPNVLTFYDSLEVENKFYLITEPCLPINVYFEQNKMNAGRQELLVSWGLYQVMSCLKFLHNEVKISQNNIREAIFVTESGDWKLGGFHRVEDFRTPKNDLNALADVIWQVFYGFHTNIPATKTLDKIPRRLHGLFKKLDSKGKTFHVSDLLSESRSAGGFFKNKFVDTLLFLEEFQLKDSSEKQTFFKNLQSNLELFPDEIAKFKILPKLIHTYEYGDAGSHVLIPMFKLGRLLDEDEYQHRIVPCLVKLFSSSDRSTRVKLLERIDEFAPHLKPQVINEKIYGNLVTGFLDTNPAVRESTVKAMVVFAEKLNYNNLNMDLMKYLAKLQGSDDQPGIRTNTTICLGKIGCYLDPSHRQRILINAFTRALKDPFPPARMAGVLALSATQQFYSLVEVGNRIIPALSPLSVDPDKQVRDQAFKAIKGFLEKLEKASENPEIIPELEAEVKAGGKASLLSTDKISSWAGLALKSLSGKFYKPQAAPPSANNPATGSSNSSNEQQNSATSIPPSSRSNSITPAPSEPDDSSNKDPFEDAFNTTPSRTSSATPSPTPSHPQQERVQLERQERTGAKPAKKPLVLKKAVPKKDPVLAELGGDDWGDLDDSFASSISLKSAPKEAPKPKTTSTAAKPKQQTFEVKEPVADKANESDDGDWDTKW
ncbi:hypothetical protein M3Y97_00029000 [Aphelenchoides bicaudatus]|nr:hypothetical protein M3Y97_00029000 [Aphelenchoides bicaudatus]